MAKSNKALPVKVNVEKGPNPLSLIQLAIEKGMDIDKLERFFQLQERWEKKEAEKAFLIGFSNFQRDCPEIKKTKKVDYPLKTGGYIKYNYAPLPEIVKQIKKPLADAGLSYRWEFTEANSLITCTCIVSHSDGHSKTSVMSGPKDDSGQKNAIQQLGSTHTYLQRYTLIGALGLASADDDIDGQVKPPAAPKEKTPDEKKKAAEVLEKFRKEMEAFKTPTEIKVNSKDMITKAVSEGGDKTQLEAECLKIYNAKKVVAQKVEVKAEQQGKIILP